MTSLHTLRKQYPKKNKLIINILIMFGIIILATLLAFLLFYLIPENHSIIYVIYVLALIFIARYTNGYLYGLFSCVISVICVNYIFTYPYFEINFTLSGYPLTFLLFLIITMLTCTMTSHLLNQADIIRIRDAQLHEAELEKMRANLLRAVSHDLRTPLTGIIGSSSSYLENYDKISSSEKKELMKSIYTDANWLLNMVENLLTVTRIQGDNLQINTLEESVEEVVSEALLRLKKRFPNVEITASVPDEMLLIPMDAILIEQVIINLIENAIVHANSQKPIELIVKNAASFVSFIIKDYGTGIPSDRLNHLFDGGAYQKNEQCDSHKGIGIGLSICKTIILSHHGQLYGENHKDGAQFTFILPKEISHES